MEIVHIFLSLYEYERAHATAKCNFTILPFRIHKRHKNQINTTNNAKLKWATRIGRDSMTNANLCANR